MISQVIVNSLGEYEIQIATEITKEQLQNQIQKNQKCIIITDENLASLHLDQFIAKLPSQIVRKLILKAGETTKTLSTVEKIYQFCLENTLHRNDLLIAFGGGVIGDITGFVAATYLRGIDYLQIPTTLIAQVDSSIGSKTGVNLKEGKNLIGTFTNPKAVLIALDYLKTLPIQETKSGIAEIIKYSLLEPQKLLTIIEANDLLTIEQKMNEIIPLCCEIKHQYVENDILDKGKRQFLNYGHTFGHGLEAYYKYQKYSHGQAIALGMLIVTKLFASQEYLEYLQMILQKYDLLLPLEVDLIKLLDFMEVDKKKSSELFKFIVIDFKKKSCVYVTKKTLIEKIKRSNFEFELSKDKS